MANVTVTIFKPKATSVLLNYTGLGDKYCNNVGSYTKLHIYAKLRATL